MASKLVEIAERFKMLQATAVAQPGDDAKITALKAEAQKGIQAGDLATADALLAEVETEQRRTLDRLAANAASTSARRGDIALTRLRYREAAQHYAKAAAVLPADGAHQDKHIDYLRKEADALYRQGSEFGDNDALLITIARSRSLLNLVPRERVSLQWAAARHNLGVALQALGERESSTARLNETVAAYREALTERTRERVPLDWAATQNNLGIALWKLGERESSTARLDEAVAAYREALTGKDARARATRLGRDPEQSRRCVAGAGRARERHGAAERGGQRALTERMRDRVPLAWAMTQNNLGNALRALGERESGTARLNEAVAAYREALMERTRERVPIQWTATQNNLDRALKLLEERTPKNDRAVETEG